MRGAAVLLLAVAAGCQATFEKNANVLQDPAGGEKAVAEAEEKYFKSLARLVGSLALAVLDDVASEDEPGATAALMELKTEAQLGLQELMGAMAHGPPASPAESMQVAMAELQAPEIAQMVADSRADLEDLVRAGMKLAEATVVHNAVKAATDAAKGKQRAAAPLASRRQLRAAIREVASLRNALVEAALNGASSSFIARLADAKKRAEARLTAIQMAYGAATGR